MGGVVARALGVGSPPNRGWVDGDRALSSQALHSEPRLKEGKRQRLPDLVKDFLLRGSSGLTLPLSGGAESWLLRLQDVHPYEQNLRSWTTPGNTGTPAVPDHIWG